jgi:hypothetical protein
MECHKTTGASASDLAVAAIDAIIERGTLADWIRLRAVALADPRVMTELRRLCELAAADLYDPWVDGHRAWLIYIESAILHDTDCSNLVDAFIEAGGWV